MSVSVFKAHALEEIGRVASSRESLIITKRGKPLAQVVPYVPPSAAPVPGKLSETLVFEQDIVSPLGADMWEASR
jgi:antitoxin (DNA-binding transcriptional repressor) of toxin-antitoxin stability system